MALSETCSTKWVVIPASCIRPNDLTAMAQEALPLPGISSGMTPKSKTEYRSVNVRIPSPGRPSTGGVSVYRSFVDQRFIESSLPGLRPHKWHVGSRS